MGCCGGKTSNRDKGNLKLAATGQDVHGLHTAQVPPEPIKSIDVKHNSNPPVHPISKVLNSSDPESSEHLRSTQPVEMSPPKASQSSSSTQNQNPLPQNNADSMLKEESKSTAENPIAPKHGSAPPVFSLQKLYLSGQWYISGVNSDQIHPEINKGVEIGFHTGAPVHHFLFKELECFMNYAESTLTIKHPDGDKIHTLVRKIYDYANIVWFGDDDVERPFPEVVETYIESFKGSDAAFQLDDRQLVASLSKGELRDLNTNQTWKLSKKSDENPA